jgi:hypothetical protein
MHGAHKSAACKKKQNAAAAMHACKINKKQQHPTARSAPLERRRVDKLAVERAGFSGRRLDQHADRHARRERVRVDDEVGADAGAVGFGFGFGFGFGLGLDCCLESVVCVVAVETGVWSKKSPPPKTNNTPKSPTHRAQ